MHKLQNPRHRLAPNPTQTQSAFQRNTVPLAACRGGRQPHPA